MSMAMFGGRRTTRTSAGRFSQQKLNAGFAWILLAVVALAPVFLGSNRPLPWSLWATVLGLAIAAYGTLCWRHGFGLRVSLASIRIEALLYGLVCVFLAIQLVPGLGALLPPVRLPGGGSFETPAISVSLGDTQMMLLRWLTYGALFFLVLQVARNEQRRLFLLRSIVAILTAHALLAVAMYYQWGNTLLGLEKWAYLDSVTGTFVNRNSFATFMAFGVCASMSLFAEATFGRSEGGKAVPWSTRLLYLLAALLMLGAAFASTSRMGLFVSILGGLGALVCGMAKGSGSRRLVLLSLGGVVLGIVVVATLYGQSIWERFLSVEQSAAVRFELYQQVWDMTLQRPWTGFGGGTFAQAYQLFHELPVNTELLWQKAHNTYLELWSDLGLVVGLAPVLLYAVLSFGLLRSLLQSRQSWSVPLAGLTAILAGAVHSLVDFSLEMQANVFVLLALVALGTAGRSNDRTERDAVKLKTVGD